MKTTKKRHLLLKLMLCCTFHLIGKWKKRPWVPEDRTNAWLKVLSGAVTTYGKKVKDGLFFLREPLILCTATVFIKASHQEKTELWAKCPLGIFIKRKLLFKIKGNLFGTVILTTTPSPLFFPIFSNSIKKKKTHAELILGTNKFSVWPLFSFHLWGRK